MIQGDICYHTSKSPDKRRSVLILTRNSAISKLNWITTTTRDLPTEVWLDENDGMHEVCAISLDNIQTAQVEKLGKAITHLSDERMKEVFKAVKYAFNFN